jgi:hypothetical protein
MIAPQSPIFGLVRVSTRMLLCCKTPLHDVEDDARMLEMQGEVLKTKDEASMEDSCASRFSKIERGWGGRGGRENEGEIRVLGLFYY